MSFVKKTAALTLAGFLATSGVAFAQVGGSDVPTDAKKQGTKENGPSSTGMSKGEANSGAMKGGAMQKDGAMKKGSDKM